VENYEIFTVARVLFAMSPHYAMIVGIVALLVVARFLSGPTQEQASAAPHSPAKVKVSAAEVVLPRDPNGHFIVDAEVNGTNIRMLADTGASYVTLGEDAAESIGLDPDSLDYTEGAHTANGVVAVAVVELDEVRVGSIVRRDVRAMVTRGLKGGLLGMSFFNTLSKVSIESDELVLKD
jgi:aspartyl protease family protein